MNRQYINITYKKSIHLRFLLLLVLAVILLTLTSCKKNETINDPIALGFIDKTAYIINSEGQNLSLKEYDEVKPYYDEYLMVKKNNKWGYIKNDGSVVTKLRFDEVYPMKENKAVVILDGNYHIIDNTGKIIFSFHNGITSNSYFTNNCLIIEQNGQYGMLKYNHETTTFNLTIRPTYDYLSNFKNEVAVVGRFNETGVIKYSYLTKENLNIFNGYPFDEAEDFSCYIAKVGIYENDKMNYQYVKMPSTLDVTTTPSYLIDNTTSSIVRYDYGTTCENNMIFVADYVVYPEGTIEDNTRYYKSFTFIDTNGNRNYDEAIESIAKKVPKNFFPFAPFYIDDIFCFINATKSIPVCNVVRLTHMQQITEDDTYVDYYEFKNANYDTDESNPVISSFFKDNNITAQVGTGYLSYPSELKTPKYLKSLNSYVTAGKIYGDKWSILKIEAVKIDKTTQPSHILDDYDINLYYFIPIIYDNIIY